MKNNQKEIDMIVEILKKHIPKECTVEGKYVCYPKFEKIANSILTKLKENEIVIAEGKNDGIYPVTLKDTSIFTIIIKNPVFRITEKPIDLEGKKVKIILGEE